MSIYLIKENNQKIKAAIYISSNITHILFMPVFYGRDDMVAVNFFFKEDFKSIQHWNLLMMSPYNRVVKSHSMISLHTFCGGHGVILVMVTGNINIHHIVTQPDRCFNSNEQCPTNSSYDKSHNTGFTVVNKAGVIIRWFDSLSKQDLFIDLTFYNDKIANYI